jgi:hypothetical protein
MNPSSHCDLTIRIACADRLARIEQMLKDRIEQAGLEHKRIENILARYDQRLSRLERWQNWMMGVAAVIGSGATVLWNLIKTQVV